MESNLPWYLKPLQICINIAFIVGSVAVLTLLLYLCVVPIQTRAASLPLLLLLGDGLSIPLQIQASGVWQYVLYCLLLLSTLLFGLLFLYSLKNAVTITMKKSGFPKGLSRSVQVMAFSLIAIAYLKQVLLSLALKQLAAEAAQFISFRFTLIPDQVLYALCLLVLARLFSFALAMQREYEQIV